MNQGWYHQGSLGLKADLCSRCQLGDRDSDHTIHMLDAQASQRMSHHTEAIVGATVLLTVALTTASGSICSMSAMCANDCCNSHVQAPSCHTPHLGMQQEKASVNSIVCGARLQHDMFSPGMCHEQGASCGRYSIQAAVEDSGTVQHVRPCHGP